ncbi:MAG: DUF2330 domain-containing protein [Oscillochloris sp.]|nr:DUF2330 domain-containing protein [Oscillochloris sp.]
MSINRQRGKACVALRRMLYPSIVIIVVVVVGMLPSAARAYGLPLDARVTFERALLISDGVRQQLITTVDLRDAAPNAAVVFPVPSTPTVDQPVGGDALFPYLIQATESIIEQKNRYVWRIRDAEQATTGNGPDIAGGVSLIGRELIGGYDVARLRADDPVALQTWLTEHAYQLPDAAAPILESYAHAGWSFVAVRLAGATSVGTLSPLRISYAGAIPVYPMQLGALSDQPVGVDLFVLSAHRSQIPALSTIFAGSLSSLSPAPPAGLTDLLAGATYLTRMRATALDPASLTTDFSVAQAPSDEPYREVVTVYEDVSVAERYGVLGVLLCLAAFSPISFMLALSVRRQIERVAPKPEDE